MFDGYGLNLFSLLLNNMAKISVVRSGEIFPEMSAAAFLPVQCRPDNEACHFNQIIADQGVIFVGFCR